MRPARKQFALSPERVAELMAQYEPLCWWLTRKVAPWSTPEVREELVAECRLIFLKNLKYYDASRGASLKTFFVRFMRRRLLEAALPELTHGIRVPSWNLTNWQDKIPHIYLESGQPDDASTLPDQPLREADDAIELPTNFWERIRHALTGDEWRIIKLYHRQGYTDRQIATLLDRSVQSVQQLRHKIYRTLRMNCPQLRTYLEG